MAVLNPSVPADREALVRALRPQEAWLVACLCAAWCRTCDEYRATFESLAARHPGWAFAWVDIEDEADLIGDHDVEDFPTLLVQRGEQVLFLGALTPQPAVAQRMLQSLSEVPPAAIDSALDLRRRLLEGD